MTTARRLSAMEPLIEPERALLRHNRAILLSAIPEVMAKLGKTEEEARRLLLLLWSPEEAALAADDWEINPLALDLLKKLNQPNGRQKLIESGLQRGADAFGLSVEDLICLVCLDPRNSLASKLELVKIANERKMPAILLKLHGENPVERIDRLADSVANHVVDDLTG
ncbi:MAG TPA: hypothetical protein PLD20_13925 [Blastocatellia bacterium]|nr:hypothetical protein [Blastocatellia bacterium]HMV83700.1 hypothetical protein [Blastocatellia bacterium]HMX24855.1 hypothetical protein [Blastocatellia bacterium]HMY70884.1 hypothetical protein [Blastocatellia bacterium]HMZ19029.1 hypothetical protein [Blastocatellia bacterium]